MQSSSAGAVAGARTESVVENNLSRLLKGAFADLPSLVHATALARPDHVAVVDGERRLTYRQLDELADRVAAALQRDGVRAGDVAAVCAETSFEYIGIFLGILRARAAVTPLPISASAASLAGMLRDCGAKVLFLDAAAANRLAETDDVPELNRVAIDDHLPQNLLADWMKRDNPTPNRVAIQPEDWFNIIYSSGTTGTPKGIIQSHQMRWGHIRRGEVLLYDEESIAVISTPMYSNTTLVSLVPALARGGTLVLMKKFNALEFLRLCEKERATHAMLVPVQYRRIMDLPEFDSFDLSSFRMKTCTSSPFAADLKADVLKRWPGALVEIYGMTEGGGTCLLHATEFPNKLHTVGRPAAGHDIRVIDEEGRCVEQGQCGEVVGHSGAMMTGYLGQPEKTREAEWYDSEGKRFIRTGDIGRFDEDGFLILVDRKKDMIISGGFNIYPSDLEAVLRGHESVAEASVVGVPSRQWGETPVAFVVLRAGREVSAESLRSWVNERVGKTQRLSDLIFVDALPRNALGKVLKTALRESYKGQL
jgi:long-chain acyl-CoA synthetase